MNTIQDLIDAIVLAHIRTAMREQNQLLLPQWKKFFPELYERAQELES